MRRFLAGILPPAFLASAMLVLMGRCDEGSRPRRRTKTRRAAIFDRFTRRETRPFLTTRPGRTRSGNPPGFQWDAAVRSPRIAASEPPSAPAHGQWRCRRARPGRIRPRGRNHAAAAAGLGQAAEFAGSPRNNPRSRIPGWPGSSRMGIETGRDHQQFGPEGLSAGSTISSIARRNSAEPA